MKYFEKISYDVDSEKNASMDLLGLSEVGGLLGGYSYGRKAAGAATGAVTSLRGAFSEKLGMKDPSSETTEILNKFINGQLSRTQAKQALIETGLKFFTKKAQQLPLDETKQQGAFVQNKSTGALKAPPKNNIDPNKKISGTAKMKYDIR
jgi:hypothetical protein